MKQLRRDVVFNCIKSDYAASGTNLKLVMNPLLPELNQLPLNALAISRQMTALKLRER